MSLKEDLEILAHELECDPTYNFNGLMTSDGDKFTDKLARVRDGIARIAELEAELSTWREGCVCTDKTRAQNTGYLRALELIKDAVCGDAYPRWHDTISTTLSRGRIADICDAALAPKR